MKSFLRRLTATALAKAKGNLVFFQDLFSGSNKRWLGKQVRDGRQDQHQEEIAEPSRDGGPGTGTSPFVSLCDGADHPSDPSAVRWRGVVLERGRALQHLADASGPGGQKGRR